MWERNIMCSELSKIKLKKLKRISSLLTLKKFLYNIFWTYMYGHKVYLLIETVGENKKQTTESNIIAYMIETIY